MNNEKKAPVLTLEILAPYLPYGLKMYHKESAVKIQTMTHFDLCEDLLQHHNKWRNKPILRPLSDLTKEIEHNGERFKPENRIDQYTKRGGDGKLYILSDGTYWSSDPLTCNYSIVIKLISWHFDVFGLIDQDLAIDINSIEGKEVGNG